MTLGVLDSVREVTTEVVLIPRPPTASVGGGFKARTQFATVVCSVATLGGLSGESYFSVESLDQAVGLAAIVADAGRVLAGLDPLARQTARSRIARELHDLMPGAGTVQVILGVIDIALWDLFGKLTGLPVWRLAGSSRGQAPCYASHGLFWGESEDQLEDSARRLVAAGFTGVKLRVGRRPVHEDVARAERVRAAVGPDVSIMVDGLWSMSSSDAIRFGRAVEDLAIAWFEDPTAEGDVAELKRVRDNVAIPIASGERVTSVGEFQALLSADVLDVAILDVYHVGGVTPWLQCAALANGRGVAVAGHAAPAYSAHLVAGTENGYVAEYFPWWDDLQGGALKPVDGAIPMTDAPGWGMPLDPSALAAYRHERDRSRAAARSAP